MSPGRPRGQRKPAPHMCQLPPHAKGVPENLLLAQLPPAARARLDPYLERVHLQAKDVLFRAHEPLDFVYFPCTAVVSFVSTLESGEALEVGIVGRDGLVGTSVLLGSTMMLCDGIVQIPGVALRMSADVLRDEVLADRALYATLVRFAQALLVRGMQMSVCNMFHTVEQRCARWLLTVADLNDNGEIPLTHDLMATMLGVHRPTVSVVLRSLHTAGIIGETRGRIVIRDRRRLERACCECRRVMRDEQRRLLGY